MALYPLPPSSNENVIDNGRNVSQMALNAPYLRSSPQPAQTMSYVSRRDASMEVQLLLQNEQEDNLEQLNKNMIFFLFLHA